MRYRLSPLAEQDLGEIWSYVADDAGVERADRLIDAVVDRSSPDGRFRRSPRASRRPGTGGTARVTARVAARVGFGG
jgi:plasmid stabilization system protein ParE